MFLACCQILTEDLNINVSSEICFSLIEELHMLRRWDEKYQFKYNKCISISRNDACSRSERPSSGLKKYKVNDHGIIICKYLESDEIDNLWPFLRLEME